MKTLTIEGSRITGIPSLYDELNRVFMADADWRLGESLDAVNDLLYGGFGAMLTDERVRIVWRDHAAARAALGRKATEEWLEEKLRHPERFDAASIADRLADLHAGTGPTYFEQLLEIFADHPERELILA